MTINISNIVCGLMLAYALATLIGTEFGLAFLFFNTIRFTFTFGGK